MSDAPITLTLDELADLIRHFMGGHGHLDPWEKLTEPGREQWRKMARKQIAGVQSRRAVAVEEARRRK